MSSFSMPNIIDLLAQTPPELAALRRRRPEAVTNAEESFRALFEHTALAADFPLAHRYAVAAFIAGISRAPQPAAFYADLLADEDESLVPVVDEAVRCGMSTGPYSGGDFIVFGQGRLPAAFDFAHLLTFHPKDASPAAIGHLQQTGYTDDAIVSLAQLISFMAFQLRVVHGLQVLAGADLAGKTQQDAEATHVPPAGVLHPGWEPGPRTLVPEVVAPSGFVNHPLGWKPWVAPLAREALTEQQREALIRPERIDQEYFRLLARDPAALKARTLTDLDIFYNTEGGLGRAERELAATVVSRLNGCEYCASVHQARTKAEGGNEAVVERLLEEGIEADLETDLWDAIRKAAVALTRTPNEFGPDQLEVLRRAGLDDLAIIDAINASAFFNWANRLMLTLGEPDVPKRLR